MTEKITKTYYVNEIKLQNNRNMIQLHFAVAVLNVWKESVGRGIGLRWWVSRGTFVFFTPYMSMYFCSVSFLYKKHIFMYYFYN